MRKQEEKKEKKIELPNINDNTSKIEYEVLHENKPAIYFLVRLFKYVFTSTKAVSAVYISLSIILSIIQPVTAFLWGRYINKVNNFKPADSVVSMVLLLTVFFIINYLSDLLNRYTALYGEDIERLNIVQKNRIQEQFDTKMYKKISSLPSEDMEVPKINDLMQRIFDFTSNAYDGLTGGVMLQGYFILSKTISVASITITLAIFNPVLSIIIILALVPTLYTRYISQKIQFKFIKDNTKYQREANYYQNIMLGEAAKEMKVLNIFHFFYLKWKRIMDDYVRKEQKKYIMQTSLDAIGSLVSVTASVSANIIAIVLLTQGLLTIGSLGAVMYLIGNLIGSVSDLFSSVSAFISKKNQAAMFFDLIDLKDQKNDGINLESIDNIKVNNLKYRYPLTDKYIIDSISLEIKKGEKVALVGENGAGKTTFVKLVTGLLTPSSGEIKFNDIVTENMNSHSVYANMGTVSQNPCRYNAFTVGENVLLGDVSNKNESDIDHALSFAELDIDKNQLLGKDIGGIDLSGGQWQKLAIARGYYRNKDYIILDEPTSNLDPIAESNVFKKYIEMSENRTVLLVTHRISVASLADRIIVFKGGKIVEDGSHSNLLNENGEYARLYESQANWYDR